jgi:subtilase family serine protease
MLKKSLTVAIFLIFILSFSVYASTSMEYLANQSLADEFNNYRSLAMVTKTLSTMGVDTTRLQNKLNFLNAEQDLRDKAFKLLATSNPDIAETFKANQTYNGSWNNDIYLTGLITYILRETGLEMNTAQNGANYLRNHPNDDGGWGNNGTSGPMDTALAVMALKKSNYNDDITQKGLQWLLLHQGGEGGWGNSINTAWACLALHEFGTNPDELKKAVDYLKMIINKDGGWGIYPGEASDPFTSALVLLALYKYDSTLPEVTKGLAYLQKLIEDEAWINKALAYYNISEICHLLWDEPEFVSIKESYLSFLKDFPDQQNYDYLARKISLMVKTGEDVAEFMTQLLTGQNSDGGWGFGPGYSSDPLDTALALRALLDSGYADFAGYQKVLAYFNSHQNSDGSFSIKKNSDGQVYLTALIVEELERLNKVLDCSYITNSSRQWLINQKNGSGGYGDGMLETARTLRVIINDLYSSELESVFAYIDESKLPNGSWNDDALTTAAVLSVLNRVKPNLAVSAADLVFTPEVTYLNAETTINVTVRNSGLAKAENILVSLYDGAPGTGTLIGTETIALLAPQQSGAAAFTWNATTTGAHEFTVVIDPDNQIIESDENDNRASKILNVLPKVDLSLAIGDIIITPEDPGPADTLTIKAMVSNLGYLDSGAFKVVFYNGDPEAGGIALATVDCLNVPGQGVAEVSYSAKLPEGNYRIYAVVDSENQIAEDRKDNNRSSQDLVIEKRVDLAISYHNVVFSKDDPVEGDLVTIYATVTNKREEPVGNVPVAFYLGNPAEDGQLMGTVVLDQISGNNTALAKLNWNTAGITGRQMIYVVVDPENTVKEVDKTNNQALQIIYIFARPDLTGTITAYTMNEGTPGNISINVKNQGGVPASNVKVRIFLGETATGRQLGEDVVISSIAAGGTNNITVTLDTINLAGTQKVSVWIDPENVINEFDESNNELSATFTVNPPVELEINEVDFTSSPSVIDEGDTVTFEAVIKNTSSTYVSNVIVRFYRYVENDWVQLGEQKVNLNGNQSQTVNFAWDSDYCLGSNSFKVEVDPDGNIYERDKTNNIVVKEFEVKAAQMPDLTVDAASIVTIPNLVARGTTCILRAEVSNLRAVTVNEVTVRFYDGDPDAGGTIIGEQVIDLPGRGSAVAEVNWDTSQVKGCREIYVWADPVNTIPEYDEANNRASRVIFLRADLSYQPQNVKATVDYHDVTLSWDKVEQPDVLGYLVYRDGSSLNRSVTGDHGTVAVSSTYSTSVSYAPENAIDDNENTYWRSTYDTLHWIEEELPEYQYVERIEILWNSVNPLIDYQIQIPDGEEYRTVATITGNTQNPSICKLGTNGLMIKKYRIVISNPNKFYANIKEITIHTREFNQSLSYLDSTLPSGNYEYTVTSLNNQGEESVPSSSVAVAVLPPVAPENFTAEVKGPNVHLSWERSNAMDCIGYYLSRDGILLGETEPVSGTPTAFASQSSSYRPEKAMDGDESTRWYYYSTSSTMGWWQMDLPLKRYITAININWQYISENFEILAWQNNNWIKISEIKNNQQAITEISFNQVYKTDKIRVNILKPYTSGNNKYFGIKEINIEAQKLITGLAFQDNLLKAKQYQYSLTTENSVACESEPVQLTVTVNPPEQPTDVSLDINGRDVGLSWDHLQETDFAGYYIIRNGQFLPSGLEPVDIGALAKASASSCYSTSASYQPVNALDRDSSTSWYSAYGVFPCWFMAELPSVKVVSGVKITWYASYYSAKDIMIQYRQNNDWYTIQRLTDQNIEEGIYNFPHPVETDAIRLYCTKGNAYYLIMREFYIYEDQPVTIMNYLDGNLRDGDYNYSIIAADKAGNWSSPSVPVTVTIGEIPTPQNLRANVEDTSVSLQWEMQAMDNVAGFRIYRDYQVVNEAQNVAGSCMVQVSANPSYAQRVNDNNKNTYWYPGYRVYPATVEMTASQVMGLSKIGVQWYSAAATDYNVLVWIKDAWITIREIRGNTELSNEINLNEILATSKVKLEILAGPNYVYLAELDLFDANLIKTTSYTDSVLENRIYTYFVKAVSTGNSLSEASNSVSVTIDEKTPPEKPTGFNVTERHNSLLLKWDPNAEADLAGYNIYLNDSVSPLNNNLLSANQHIYSVPVGVANFEFRLYAIDINGNQSSPAVVTFQFDKPEPPTNLKTVIDKRDITLTWNNSASLSIRGYKIYRNGVLINRLSRISPNTVNASSYYCNNSNYRPQNISDGNINTFWRPGLNDSNPYIEIQYSSIQLISAVEIGWHDVNERPSKYTVEAWVNGSWRPLISDLDVIRHTITLSSVVATERLRLTIKETNNLVSLSEFNGYTASLVSSPYKDLDLTPGFYNYEVTAVNIAGLESQKPPVVTAEITTRDVAILSGDLYYTPYNPSVFDNITISVNVKNTGALEVDQVPVALYFGDPNSGGALIASLTTASIKPGEKSLVQYVWDPTGFAGEGQLFAVADPEGLIPEYDETNNSSARNITISSFSKLETSVANIDSSGFPAIKLGVQVNDALGEGIAGLRKENFTILENGIKQEILSVVSKIDTGSELAKIDLVFIIDTSGSMYDEWDYLPDILTDLTNTLTKMGIDINYKVYALYSIYGSFPEVEALTKGIFKGNEVNASQECWGPGTAWVAKNYSWREGAYRIVIPISDEDCYQGSGQTQEDLDSIAEATQLCKDNNVEAYPFHGFSDTAETVKNQMRTLAQGTGGEMFFFQDAIQVVNYLSRVLSQKRVHYTIEYKTSNQSKDGTLRTVTIDASYRQATGTDEGQYRAPQDTFCDLAFAGFDSEFIHSEKQSVNLNLIVQNNGGIPAENGQVEVYLGNPADGGILLSSENIDLLAPNEVVTLEIPWITIPGTHQFYAVVDPRNEIVELNEGNNLAILEVRVPGNQLPDLLVLDEEIVLSNDTPSYGQKIEIRAKVHNLGSDSGVFEVGFYQGHPAFGGKLIGAKKVPSLSYLGYQDLVCTWITDIGSGEIEIYVIADPLNLIEEHNESNNQAIKIARVSERMLSGGITTNKPGYAPNENALFNLTVINRQAESWTGSAGVVIKDLQNREIERLPRFEIYELLGDVGNGPGEWNQSQIWNVGSQTPGKYFAVLELYENGDHFAEFITGFEVYASRAISGVLYTDKTVYAPNERAVITVDYTNESLNSNLEDLILKVRALNQTDEVWSEEVPISILPIAGRDTITFNWPIAIDAIGDYQVISEISDGAEILWSSAKEVRVDPTVALIGTLSIQPKEGRNGDAINLTYNICNRGNVNVEEALVEILFVDPATENVVTIITRDCSLELGEEKSESLAEIIHQVDAQYMVVLQANVNGKIIPLSSAALLVDSTPPVTAAELSNQRLNKDGVFYGTLNSELILTAVDNLSGVAETLLDIGAGFQPYTGPVAFPAEGKYSVRYKSIDRLGNDENVKELMVVIDETPPVATIISPIDNQEVAPEFIVNLTASDNVGLDYFELYINEQKFANYTVSPVEQVLQLEPGSYILKARAIDLTGYETWSAPVNIKVQKADTTPPVTIAEYPVEWTNQDVTVILTATDDLSGVKETRYRIDDGQWQAGTILQINTEGTHSVEFYSIDNADNGEIVKSITVRIDRTKPVTEIKLTGAQKPDGAYQSNVTVNITAIDNLNGSGINRIYYRIGVEGGYQPYTEPLVITTEGLNEVYAYAVDNAGNHEEPQRVEFKIGKGWQSDYSLICNKLTIYGHLNVDRVFVNGPVNIYGHCNLNYLGTTEKTILKTGPSTIDLLRTEQPHQAIPAPDWEGLKTVTELRQEKQIPKDVTLNNVRFENSLMIAGTTKLSGLIVVKGDLTINGNVDLNDAGIFCSGKITFNGNVQGSGLICGAGLVAHGNPQLNGAMVVDGPVEASGTIGNQGVDLQEFLKWFDR